MGKQNLDANALSRRPHDPLEDDYASKKERERIRQFTLYHLGNPDRPETVSQEVIKAICERHMVTSAVTDVQATDPALILVESLTHQSTAIPDCFQQEQGDGSPLVHSFSEEELRQKKP